MGHEDTMIFSAELDNDAARILHRESAERATLAYVLLGTTILWHPAYDLQDNTAHLIMLGPGSDQLSPPLVKLVMGKGEYVSDYMPDRIKKLADVPLQNGARISELEEYRQHSADDLKRRYDELDERFTLNDGVLPVSWSRDAKFRELVRQELVRDPRWNLCLGSLLLGHAPYKVVEAALHAIEEHTIDGKPVVSCDTILAIVRAHGFHERVVRPFEDRLHILHWMAQEGPGIHIPLVSRLYRKTIDPYDPEVFWCAVTCLMGEDNVNMLNDVAWPERLRICHELREDVIWARFIQTYHDIVKIAEEERDGLDEKAALAEVRKHFPGKAQHVFSHLGRINVAVLAVSVAATTTLWIVNPPIALTATVGLKGFGVVSGVWSLKKVLAKWRESAKGYEFTDRHELQHRLRTLIRQFHQKS